MIGFLYSWVLGDHPNNTIFSYNWHNVRHINRFFADAARALPEKKLVFADIGGGRSPYFDHFLSRQAAFHVVDLADSLPREERRPIVQHPGFAENIPLTDEFADVVLCNQVLEHVVDPEQSVREMHRILRHGGWIIGSVPHVSPIHLEPYDFRRYTRYGLKQILVKAGFEDVRVEGSGGVFSAAALMVCMDVMLSRLREGSPQSFLGRRALVLSPIVGLINAAAWVLDRILGDKGRTPANLCWTARKRTIGEVPVVPSSN